MSKNVDNFLLKTIRVETRIESGKKYYVIFRYGDILYYKDERCTILHREDGPAIEWKNGDKHWFINGNRHREDGAAIEYVYGAKSYYLNGKLYSEKDYWGMIRLGSFF